ncbi:MAG: ATP-binding protein [bacterium]
MHLPVITLGLEQAILFAIAAVNLSIGALVLSKNPKNVVNMSFFAFVLGTALWMSGISLLYVTHNFAFDKMALGGGIVMLFGMTLFARTFASREPVSFRFAWFFLPLACTALLLPFGLYILGIVVDENGIIHAILGPLFPVYALANIGHVSATLWFLSRNLSVARGKQRMQILYLAVGIFIFAGSFIVFDLIFPYLGMYQLNLLGPASSIAFVALTAYAIVRHQLMDIRVVIQRGLIYSALLGLITGFYLVAITAFGSLGAQSGTAAFLGGTVTAAVGIFSAPLIERCFRRMTDRIFFKDTYDYAEALRNLSEVLYTSVDFGELTARAEAALITIFRASSVRISVPDSDADEEDPSGRTMYVPIAFEGATVGAIRIGEKRSGDAYTSEDAKLLATFAYQAATALSRARLYEQVKRHAEELEQKVAERTEELRRAQESQRQMLNDISHNLQTPLAIFQTKIERLKRILVNDGEVAGFEQSLSALSNFIYDLLSLANLDQAASEGTEDVPLTQLCAEIAEELVIIAAPRGIEVTSAIEPGIVVRGNAKRLREAVMNIASNAVKYMRAEGRKEIRIALARADGGTELSISDTGIGILPEDRERVFERFYRGKNTPYDARGTGLGLAFAKRIIEQQGGSIAVESELGEGTRMRIRFPDRK